MIVTSEKDRQRVRASGSVLARVLNALVDSVHPGVSSDVLEQLARTLIADAGASPVFLNYQPQGEPRPYPAATCISVNDMVVHGIPNEHPFTIEDGDIVSIDCGVVYDGIVTDATRTTIAGTPRPEDERLLAAAKEALAVAVRTAKTGARVGDVSHAIEEVAKKYGYGIPREVGGHGVGIRLHEDPFVPNWGNPGAGAALLEGQMLAIEPIFTAGSERLLWDDRNGYECRSADGSRAVQEEETIIVGKDGGEIVTSV